MTFTLVLDEIRKNMAAIIGDLGVSEIGYSVEPAKPEFGDVTCNAPFLLSRHLKRPPPEIAVQISETYRDMESPLVSGIKAHPSGYLNFTANMGVLGGIIIRDSVSDGYGAADIGKSSRVVVEHTSVNPNKALHIGHVRNIVIGDTLARILAKANYDVRVLNYVDDLGQQVADIVLGFQRLGFPEEPPAGTKFDHYCGDQVYVRTTEQYDKDPGLRQAGRDILKEIEEGESETAAFADRVTKRVLAAQLQTCWNLSVTYDCLNYESQIIRSGLWSTIFEKLKSMNLIDLESEGENAGCWVIRGRPNEADKVIVRSNGTVTYMAKDIPYAAWKLGLVEDPFSYAEYAARQPGPRTLWQTTLDGTGKKKDFAGDMVITVIDSRQARLQDIITVLMNKFKSLRGAYVHLGYESVTLSPETARDLGVETGRQMQMSGRRGLYVSADAVYDMLVAKASAETRKRNPDLPDSEIAEIARAISVGTLRYEMIRQDLDKTISFDLAQSLSLEGDTASYIQYTHARASRILEKAGIRPDFEADCALLEDEYERALIRQIGMLGEAVGSSASNLSPKGIARYCHDLAVAFNSFYEHVKVLDSDSPELVNARVCLVSSFSMTLEKALELLGIAAPRRM